VDIIGCPRIEDDGTKENAGGQHRADFKADRRGHSAKGVQSGTFTRYASLKSAVQTQARSSPALVRGFIVGRMEWSELVEPRHHVRRGVKSASEDALRKCESIYSPEAIAVRPYWHPLGTLALRRHRRPRRSSCRAVAPFPRPRPLRVGPRSRNFAAPFRRKISFAIGRIFRTSGRTPRSVQDLNSADCDAWSG
jgi:hypothetical protein